MSSTTITDTERLFARIAELERELEAKAKTTAILVARVEGSLANRSSAFALFEQNIALERVVADRTRELREQSVKLEHALELRHANEALKRTNRAKDEFLATMSHELRTPLNAILGLSEALDEEVYGPLVDKQRQTLRRIGESGRHLLALINDILDLSKIEAGKGELETARVCVDDLCRASVRFIQDAARRKHLLVSLHLDDNLAEIVADERRLKQVVVNLLSNAVKFTPEGGRIGLETALDAARGTLRITVWDTGIGIARDDVGQLFQPFVQLDGRLSRQHPGTGLGLALVKRLVELHGGEVTLESELGVGSRFTVALPGGESGDAPKTAPASAEPAVRAAPMRILLADDEETNADVLVDFLSMRGHTVIVARDGREAVALARAARPDFILMDIQMPFLDGLAAIGELRADSCPELRRVPIVAVTALALAGDEERCLAAGANHYLTKPLSLRNVAAIIEAEAEGVPRPAP